MRANKTVLSAALCLIFVLTAGAAGERIDRAEYAKRRAKLMAQIGDGVAVIRGAAPPSGSFKFNQSTDFMYLTGVEIPNAALIVDGPNRESLLFFSMSEREAAAAHIPLELIRDPTGATGIEKVFPAAQFSPQLSRLSRRIKIFHTPFRPEELSRDNTNEKFNSLQRHMTLDLWDGRLTRELQFVKQLTERFPQIEVRDCSSMIWNQRMIKSPAEIGLLRKAAQIGVKAHSALMQSTRAGIGEYELAAVFEFICKKEGAQDLAYETIIMSGKNHAYGHYHGHDRILEAGDFLILDAGPDYGYYHADISSSFPADGKFSPEQRELYELGLRVRQVCLDNYRPGISFREIGEKVRKSLIAAGVDPASPQLRGEIRYGGYNHMIGLATHDPVGTFAGPEEVLKPGFVFACDIGISYPQKEIGIRIEDTVAVTESGYENLSQGLPRTVAEIESLMQKDGIIQILKKTKRYRP